MANRRIQSVCKSNSYEKLYGILKARIAQASSQNKQPQLENTDLENIKTYIEKRIADHLGADGSIPAFLMKAANLLGPEYIAALRPSITNYIVAQRASEFNQFLTANFVILENHRIIYDFLEKQTEELAERITDLPAIWNTDLKVLTISLSMIKQRIESLLAISEPSLESLSKLIYETIKFEKKIKPFLTIKKCCVSQIGFRNDEIISPELGKCAHFKMLSTIFVPYVREYVMYLLKQLDFEKVDCEKTQVGILEQFLVFFKEIERILPQILYFESTESQKAFILAIDEVLRGFLLKMYPASLLPQAIAVLSTVIFIQDTLRDLFDKFEVFYSSDIVISSFDVLRRIEKLQSARIERILSINMPRITADTSCISDLQSYFETSVFFPCEMAEDARLILLETAMSLLFSRISVLRMSQSKSLSLLTDIADLERFLIEKCHKIPHLREIKEYLQIFACPTLEKEKFVENFIVLSEEKFNFYQILNVMEDQEDAAQLFMIYKKIKKRAG